MSGRLIRRASAAGLAAGIMMFGAAGGMRPAVAQEPRWQSPCPAADQLRHEAAGDPRFERLREPWLAAVGQCVCPKAGGPCRAALAKGWAACGPDLACFKMFGLLPQTRPRPPTIAIDGADLFIDLRQWAGNAIFLRDAGVWGVDNTGGFIEAGGVTFKLSADGIDPESFRFLLKHCAGIVPGDECRGLLLQVTPTGEKRAGWQPVLKFVSIVWQRR